MNIESQEDDVNKCPFCGVSAQGLGSTTHLYKQTFSLYLEKYLYHLLIVLYNKYRAERIELVDYERAILDLGNWVTATLSQPATCRSRGIATASLEC